MTAPRIRVAFSPRFPFPLPPAMAFAMGFVLLVCIAAAPPTPMPWGAAVAIGLGLLAIPILWLHIRHDAERAFMRGFLEAWEEVGAAPGERFYTAPDALARYTAVWNDLHGYDVVHSWVEEER